MAAGNWIRYNSALQYLFDGTIDWDTDTLKMVLLDSGYTPDLAHSEYSDISADELATGSGYTNGGQALTGVVSEVSGTVKLSASADTTWTASGGNITARYAAVYVDVMTSFVTKPLIGYVLLDNSPADVTALDGYPLTVKVPANGLFNFSGGQS